MFFWRNWLPRLKFSSSLLPSPSSLLSSLPPSFSPSLPPSFSPQPENILLYRKGSLDIKIADFGLSVQLREGQKMRNLVGTAEYVGKYSVTGAPSLWPEATTKSL